MLLQEANLEALFVFSLVWSVGATTDGDGRKKMDAFFRKRSQQTGSQLVLPSKGYVLCWSPVMWSGFV